MLSIKRYPDHDLLSRAAAEYVVSAYERAINRHGHFTLVLSGGRTPKKLYQLLAEESFSKYIDWSLVHIFWGDERSVPPHDSQSNFRMARLALLDEVPIPAHNIHRVHSEDSPADAAAHYEALLLNFFQKREEGGAVRFDLVLLGIGDDAHMASLFPDTAALNVQDRLVVENYIPKLDTWRITFTPQVLNQAYEVLFVVSGADKAPAMQQIIEGPLAVQAYPAQLVNPDETNVTWLLDNAAAKRLADH